MLEELEAGVNPAALLQAVMRTIIELHIQAQFTERRSTQVGFAGGGCDVFSSCTVARECRRKPF